MNQNQWTEEFPAAITVCDRNGIILEMNEMSIRTFSEDGGEKLIGKNLLECHPEPARKKLAEMLDTKKKNVYTIEKKGIKKLIFQSPWYKNGIFCGFVEISFEIPFDMPHFVRE